MAALLRLRRFLHGMLFSLLLAPVWTGSNTLVAQGTGEIAGQVFSPEGETLPYTAVQLLVPGGSKQAMAADGNGRFAFTGLRPGPYRLAVSYVGFLADTVAVDAVADGVRQVKLYLRSRNSGPTLVVRGHRMIAGGGDELVKPISGKELKRMPFRNPSAAVAARAPRVYDREGDGGTLHVAGSRSDAVAFIVDGVRMIGSLDVPASAVADVTLYAGGIPARYGDVTGGVIVIRTKSYLAFLD